MPIKQESRILFCQCASAEIIPLPVKQEVHRALEASGLPFDTVSDLCGLAARKASILKEHAGRDTQTIIACHPRAVRWLFAAGGAPLHNEHVAYLNMREDPIEDLVRRIREIASIEKRRAATVEVEAGMSREIKGDPPSGEDGNAGMAGWKSWFPVIDYERCRNCRQCLGFCLFGVYGSGQDGKVEVRNPTGCKADCPACARICPETAIIFPKYSFAPINGGEGKAGEQMADPVKVDLTRLTNEDILKVLQERSRKGSRFSADPDRLEAIRERLVHLAGMQTRIDTPPDTVALDPSVGKESE